MSRNYPTTTSGYRALRSPDAEPEPEAGPAVALRIGHAGLPGMDDLSATSGLPLWLDRQHADLILTHPGGSMRTEAQPLRLVRDVLLEPGVNAPEYVYWSFRDVILPADEAVFDENGVRHNLLLLRPGRMGAEFTKTRGHVQVCDDGEGCPEVYGVLHGRALFLLQQMADSGSGVRVLDVRWIEAQPGQKVVVPAGYGAVVSNLGVEDLVLSQLAAVDAWPVHVMYERMHGAAYYITGRDGALAVEPNRCYEEPLPEVREDAPLSAPDMGVEDSVPLYTAFVYEPERFAWLRQRVPMGSQAR